MQTTKSIEDNVLAPATSSKRQQTRGCGWRWTVVNCGDCRSSFGSQACDQGTKQRKARAKHHLLLII